MPIFEYRCEGCGATHEIIVLSSESPPDVCPNCGGELRRLWSRIGAQFVGWGFSRNDSLLADDKPRRPFRQIRDKAAELFD